MSMKNETEIQKRARELGKEPAFPTSSLETAFGYTGLTKREKLAAMAMQGMLSRHNYEYIRQSAAHNSLQYADALLIALAESEVQNG